MRSISRVANAVLLAAAVSLCACGGPPLATKEQAATGLTRASMPANQAQGAAMSLLGSYGTQPGISIHGSHGGEATLEVNPVELAVGLAGKGLMIDIEYSDYSEDGIYRLDGTLSVLGQFQYTAAEGEDPTADLKLSLVGHVRVSGVYSDDLHAHVTLVTKLEQLGQHDGHVDVQVNGSVDSSQGRFEFNNDGYTLTWNEGKK